MSEFLVEIEQEEDGRRIAEIPHLPGVMAYGYTREEAVLRAEDDDAAYLEARRLGADQNHSYSGLVDAWRPGNARIVAWVRTHHAS